MLLKIYIFFCHVGIAIDSDTKRIENNKKCGIELIKKKGKVAFLEAEIQSKFCLWRFYVSSPRDK